MVNALIPDLPTPTTKIEIKHIIQYLRQLHFLRGFETIYTPEKSLVNQISLNFLREFPERFERNMNSLIEVITEKLNSILWDMKKTDYMDADLTSFTSLYSLWLRARSMKAVIVFCRLHLLSPVLHLSQLLISDRRDFIGNLADDIELWFFSHLADVQVQLPFFIDFSEEIRDLFSKRIDINKLHKLLNDLCKYPTSDYEWKERGETLSRVINYGKVILRLARSRYRNQIVITSYPVAISNKSFGSFERLPWNYPSLKAIFKNVLLQNDTFNPFFILDTLYPRELLERMEPLEKIPLQKTPILLDIKSERTGYQAIELAHRKFLERLSQL